MHRSKLKRTAKLQRTAFRSSCSYIFVNSRWSYRIYANLGIPWNSIEIVYDFLKLNSVIFRRTIHGMSSKLRAMLDKLSKTICWKKSVHVTGMSRTWQRTLELLWDILAKSDGKKGRYVGCLEHDPSPPPFESCMIQITAQVGDHLRWEEDAAHWGNGFLEQLIICARQPWKCNRTLNYLLKSNIRFFWNLFQNSNTCTLTPQAFSVTLCDWAAPMEGKFIIWSWSVPSAVRRRCRARRLPRRSGSTSRRTSSMMWARYVWSNSKLERWILDNSCKKEVTFWKQNCKPAKMFDAI